MLKSLRKFLDTMLDAVLPPRSDFELVRKLSETDIQNLPKADAVDNGNREKDWIHPLFAYRNGKVRAVIWELKYRGNTKPLDTIGRMLYEEILALVADVATFDSDAKFLLLPIPISAKRRQERGYNQSEYVAKAILARDFSHALLYAPQWFSKARETEEQNKSHSREERLRNLTGSFSADPRVEGFYAILIDDVVTTGATLSEARATLLSSGAKEVYAFTIAH
jgi:ComF family protein